MLLDSADRISTRNIGTSTRPARHTALLDMAKDVPAPVLCSLLDISL